MRPGWLLVATLSIAVLVGPALAQASKPHATALPGGMGPTIDADTLPKGSTDANWVLRWLGHGKYALEVQNTSGIGYLNTFEWITPPGITIVSVTSTTGGSCKLVHGDISCAGTLKPPLCTCLPGGNLTTYFTAKGLNPTVSGGTTTNYGVAASYLVIKTVTPVPYHIPSALSSKDL
jgi:hypothetical protein